MKKAIIIILILFVVLYASHLIGTGLVERYDVCLRDFWVSDDGTKLTFTTDIFSSMGHTRGYKDNGGGVKPHYLTFYATFGGINSTFGAKNEFILPLGKNDTEIYFADIGGGYKLVLKKNEETGTWERR